MENAARFPIGKCSYTIPEHVTYQYQQIDIESNRFQCFGIDQVKNDFVAQYVSSVCLFFAKFALTYIFLFRRDGTSHILCTL